MKIGQRILSLAILTSIAVYSCSTSSTEPEPTPSPKIETGTEVPVITQSVSSGGGRIIVTAPDSLIGGLEISVPANSYTDTRLFTVSYAPVKSHTLGEFFKPISPVITISNGGGYADSIMAVQIPATIADSVIPLAFFYNDVSGALEGIPVIAYDHNSVTIATRHFDVSGIAAGSPHSKSGTPQGTISNFSRIVLTMATPYMVSAISRLSPLIRTGYYPGADDWDFVNYGSYLLKARAGHCAGQNSSSLWYYFELRRKKGAPMLHHLYDSIDVTPNKIWEDNPQGYRWASAVQQDMDWTALTGEIYEKYVSAYDNYTWTAFVVSMYLTGEPFDVGLYGFDGTGRRGGHDVTAYSIDVPNQTIYIADPNYPGDRTRSIKFNGSTFDPYYAGLNAAEGSMKFNSIKFTSKTAFIDWTTIGIDHSLYFIQKMNPRYPDYSLWVNVVPSVKLGTAYHSSTPSVDVSVSWNEVLKSYFTVYDRNGDRLLPAPTVPASLTDRGIIALKPGENIIGFAIFGDIGGTPKQYRWVDFRWIHFFYDTILARIEPATTSGVKNQQYTWSGIVMNRPSDARFEWDFGDGSSKFIRNNDTVAYHSYTNDGDYTITLDVFNRSTNIKVASATATASIHSGIEVTSVWPSEQSFAMPVHITGKNFGTSQGSSTVLMGPYPAYSIVSWSPTEIVATVPEMFSGGNVTVTVGGVTTAGVHLGFKGPAITSVKPDSAYPGDMITIKGEGFGALQAQRSTVEFNSNEGTIVSWSDTTLLVIVPEVSSYGSVLLDVTVSNGYLDRWNTFRVRENFLNTLHGMNCLSLAWFNAKIKKYYSTPSPHESFTTGGVSISSPLCSLSYMKWSGTSFSQQVTDNTVPGTTEITTVAGTVSSDGSMISTITVKYQWTRAEYSRTEELTFTDIPVSTSSPHSSMFYSMTGLAIQNHVSKVVDETTKSGVSYEKYLLTDWTDTPANYGIYVNFEND
ncbi:MAG: IPT/TIG domain-containing protein [Bacteroidetes bacterium]|nr:IPT/TIG domain-containing protein [Bacteroidota bacterium]